MPSAEHEFLSATFHDVLARYARTPIIGIREADRRRFDYACVVMRDFSRPLVSQVLWGHEEGLEKDLRTLLHEGRAAIKTYLVRDSTRSRARIDEIIADYERGDSTRPLLTGLRIIFVPPDFDADREVDCAFMNVFLARAITSDILFRTVFGGLTHQDVDVFIEHGGPTGLKYAMLDEITTNGLIHTPTFKDRLGYRTNSPIREAAVMLAATGLARRVNDSVMLLPSFKGRMLLDLIRWLLLMGESAEACESRDTALVLEHLRLGWGRADIARTRRLLAGALGCRQRFERDLLAGVDASQPRLYSTFDWRKFYDEIKGAGVDPDWFVDSEALYFPED